MGRRAGPVWRAPSPTGGEERPGPVEGEEGSGAACAHFLETWKGGGWVSQEWPFQKGGGCLAGGHGEGAGTPKTLPLPYETGLGGRKFCQPASFSLPCPSGWS